MMKKNYVKNISEYLDLDGKYDDVDPDGIGSLDRSSLEINVEVIDGKDGRVVILEQDGQTMYIPEDKVDHYMSEIMGLLDSLPSNQEDDINLDFPKF